MKSLSRDCQALTLRDAPQRPRYVGLFHLEFTITRMYINGRDLLYKDIGIKHNHLVGFLPTVTTMSKPIDTPC